MPAVEDAGQPEPAGHAQCSCDMSMRQGTLYGDRILEVAEDHAALEQCAQSVDQVRGQVGEAENGFMAHAFAFAPGFSQEDLGSAVAVGNDIDAQGHGIVHVNIYTPDRAPSEQNNPYNSNTCPLNPGKIEDEVPVSDDEQVLSVDTGRLLSRWPDLPETVMIPVYPLVEIAGEKLRCIMQRMQCRDLFDLWFLAEYANIDPHDMVGVFRSKTTHRNLNPDAFEMRYRSRLDQYRRRWDNELQIHAPGKVPHIEQVERTVARLLRGTGLL